MITTRGSRDHASTTTRLLQEIERRGLRVFARIDHAQAAAEVGLRLGAEEVIVFGNPRGGTPLMNSDRRVGLDLPLRILIWEEDDGVQLGYHDPLDLLAGYELSEHRAALVQMASLLGELVAQAAA